MELKMTTEQEAALAALFNRMPLYKGVEGHQKLVTDAGWTFVHGNDRNGNAFGYWRDSQTNEVLKDSHDVIAKYKLAEPMSYAEFLETVQQGHDCLMVKWAGMWIGIEKDGYTHS